MRYTGKQEAYQITWIGQLLGVSFRSWSGNDLQTVTPHMGKYKGFRLWANIPLPPFLQDISQRGIQNKLPILCCERSWNPFIRTGWPRCCLWVISLLLLFSLLLPSSSSFSSSFFLLLFSFPIWHFTREGNSMVTISFLSHPCPIGQSFLHESSGSVLPP